jgi:hypothetical protein
LAVIGRLELSMDAVTLYALAICAGFTPQTRPCSEPSYSVYDRDSDYHWTRAECLRKAGLLEAKDPVRYKAYCIGKDGVLLDATGRIVDRTIPLRAMAEWYDRPASEREKLTSQQVFEIRW